MARKLVATAAVFLVLAACVFGAGRLVVGETSAVVRITDQTSCPVSGCASGACHGFDNVPEPDGVAELLCPEAGCASAECHAWDTLLDRYHRASSFSLNLWVLAPALLVALCVVVFRGAERSDT